MPSPPRYAPKRKGHPCMEKRIKNDCFDNLIEMIMKIKFVKCKMQPPGSSLVTNNYARDITCTRVHALCDHSHVFGLL